MCVGIHTVRVQRPSSSLPALPSEHSQNHYLVLEMGEGFHRGELLSRLVFTEEFTGLSGREKNSNLRTPSFFGHTQLNLSQNYSSVLGQTLKACPSTLPSLQMGLGKESRDTVKSESLLENQIHRLGKFSRATPSWPVGKPQRDCQRLQGGQS